jgi:hypothetical protein
VVERATGGGGSRAEGKKVEGRDALPQTGMRGARCILAHSDDSTCGGRPHAVSRRSTFFSPIHHRSRPSRTPGNVLPAASQSTSHTS